MPRSRFTPTDLDELEAARLAGMSMGRPQSPALPLSINAGSVSKDGRIVVPEIRPLQGLDLRKLGSSASMVPGQTQTLVDARTSDTDLGEMVTITTGMTVNGNGSHHWDLHALLDWGIGGANYSADVDIGKGNMIGLCANYVRVTAVYEAVVNGPTLQVNASVGYHAPGQAVAPRRTFQLGQVLNGASATVDIPPFAHALHIFAGIAGVFPGGPVEVHFGPLGTRGIINWAVWTNGAPPFPIPIMQGAETVIVRNTSGGDLPIVVVFELAL